MFKSFLLSPEYSFDLKGNCRINGLDTVNESEFINIKIDGTYYTFFKKWLGLLSHYEINFKLRDVYKIDFVECKSKVMGIKCGLLMVFKRPITSEGGFRVIPGFSRYAINKRGDVKVIKSGKILKSSISPYGYPYVNVYDPDKNKWRSVVVHILLARAFVPNIDPLNRLFVNHKDGDKKNLSINNLEWVSSVRNNTHAVEAGLRKDNIPCQLKDIETSIVTHHPSLKAALKAIGIQSNKTYVLRNANGKQIPRLLLKRYELKSADDKSDWFYTKENVNKEKYLNTGPYQAKNIKTGIIFEAETISILSEKTGVSKDKIEYILKQTTVRSNSGFLFRKCSMENWPEEYLEIVFHKPRSFTVTNEITGEQRMFKSLRQTTAFLGIDKRTLKNRLKDQKSYYGWTIEEI